MKKAGEKVVLMEILRATLMAALMGALLGILLGRLEEKETKPSDDEQEAMAMWMIP